MSRPRLVGACAGLVLLVLLAGCAGIGSVTSEEGLEADPPREYQWDTDANGSIILEGDYYLAVYQIDDRDEMRFYQQTGYGDDRPISMRSVQFRHQNGTVVNASAISVEETRSGVSVSFPADEGQFAYTGSYRSRNFGTQRYVNGEYEVILPPGYRVDNLILGTVRPGGYESTIIDDRLHLRWDDLTAGSIIVRYYLERDVMLLGGLVVVASSIAGVFLFYVYRQMQTLKKRRIEMGLDVEKKDDQGRKPPWK